MKNKLRELMNERKPSLLDLKFGCEVEDSIEIEYEGWIQKE